MYSTTLEAPSSARTGIERTFDPDAVSRLELVEERSFGSGLISARYRTRELQLVRNREAWTRWPNLA